MLLACNPRISVLTGSDYEHWLETRPRLVRPGTPLWVTLNSQFGEAVRAQTNALTHTTTAAPSVDPEQLGTLLRTACTSGARGFVIQSGSSLTENDAGTKSRAAELELLNRRMELMEPWLAGGKVVTRIKALNGEVTGAVLYVDRARLLLPFAELTGKNGSVVPLKGPAPKDITFLVPGVPELSQVYFMTLASMRLLSSERVAGGTRITVPAPGDGLVVITEDSQVVQSLRQHILHHGSQSLRLERDLVIERAKSVFDVDQRLARAGVKPTLSANDASAVNARLAQLDTLISSGQLEEAQELAATEKAEIRRMIAAQERAVGLASGLENNALALTQNRLADYAALQKSFEYLRGGDNLLPGGDFENLGEMTQYGWQHVVHPTAGADTDAELSTDQPQHGAYCLELHAAAPAVNQLAVASDTLVWIVSPSIPIEAGKTVEITGWVRVDPPYSPPGNGLVIIDSIGGPELSLLVGQTSGWQMFRMVCAAVQAADLRLTFALNGVGTAKVDAVMVRTLEQPLARRLPAVSAGSAPPQLGSTTAPGPIFMPPQTR